MIAPEIKEAWEFVTSHLAPYSEYNRQMRLLANAYVEAEWRRRSAKFTLNHYGGRLHEVVINGQKVFSHCDDGHHLFTDDQWRAEVLKELGEP